MWGKQISLLNALRAYNDCRLIICRFGQDLEIKYVSISASSSGQWKVVDFGEDYKIKVVQFGE